MGLHNMILGMKQQHKNITENSIIIFFTRKRKINVKLIFILILFSGQIPHQLELDAII